MPEWIKSHADEDEWTINPAYTRLKRDLNQLSKDIITFVNAQGGWITNADAQTRLANALATNINQISVTLHSTSGYGEMV